MSTYWTACFHYYRSRCCVLEDLSIKSVLCKQFLLGTIFLWHCLPCYLTSIVYATMHPGDYLTPAILGTVLFYLLDAVVGELYEFDEYLATVSVDLISDDDRPFHRITPLTIICLLFTHGLICNIFVWLVTLNGPFDRVDYVIFVVCPVLAIPIMLCYSLYHCIGRLCCGERTLRFVQIV